MKNIACIALLLISMPAAKLAQAQDQEHGQYQEQHQKQEQYRAQQDQRFPTTMSNGDVIVPIGSGYSNTRNGDFYPEVAPGLVINPQTGIPILTP